MVQKLKDAASFLKAKIGGDELDEKLVESVSEENWQTSTHILHEIANAAYNYQKWQRINQFIWEKLKKSKSWKKILKTLNLIEFLLKNGPPSVINSFKYDVYQIRTFESYSHYKEGVDRGESIRERAKVVVNLLTNEEVLEEERVKAKTIREKMSNVIGGSSGGYGSYDNGSSSGYGGSGYSGYGGGMGGNKYDSYGSKPKKDATYSYGNEGLGVYGDYTYNKSTLDKYKDKKADEEKNTGYSSKGTEEKKPDIVVEQRKPFEKIASKLSKPGERKPVVEEPKPAQQTPQTTTQTNINNTGGDLIGDIFGSAPTAPTTTQPQSQPQPQPQTQPTTTSNTGLEGFDLGFGTTNQTAPPAQQSNPVNQPPQLHHQPQPQPQSQPQPQPGYSQFNPQPPMNNYPPQNTNFMPNQPYNQGYYNPNPYGQLQMNPHAYNQYPPQNNYGQYPSQNYGPYNPNMGQSYPPQQTQPPRPQPNMGITLDTKTTKKQDDEFGNFNTVNTASNVNWLSNTEKGLLDFSDFGAEMKQENKSANNSQKNTSNNIQIDNWAW